MQTIDAVILGVGVLIPAMIVTGFMPEWDVLPLWGWMIITSISGGIGGALLSERLRGAALIAGLLGGAGTLGAMIVYVPLRAELSESFFTIEFVIPAFIGCLPGLLVYGIASMMFGARDDEPLRGVEDPFAAPVDDPFAAPRDDGPSPP